MNINYKFYYIFSLATLNFFSLFINKIYGSNLDLANIKIRNNLEKIPFNTKKVNDFVLNYELINNTYNFAEIIKNNISKYNHQITTFLALNQENNLGNVEIESNIQYQRDNIYYAEGDVFL